jgi:hypothetical protein
MFEAAVGLRDINPAFPLAVRWLTPYRELATASLDKRSLLPHLANLSQSVRPPRIAGASRQNAEGMPDLPPAS